MPLDKNSLNEVIKMCMQDQAMKDRFMAEPEAVLAENDIDLDEGVGISVKENDNGTLHLHLTGVSQDGAELSDQDLASAFGGSGNESEEQELNWSSNITWD